MTNEALSAILDYLYSEASLIAGAEGADQLLRSIDDVRDVLRRGSAPSVAMEEFDMVRCATATADILNLASGKRVEQVVLQDLPLSLVVTQDRKAVEQLLTRVLDCALKLAQDSDSTVSLRIAGQDKGLSSPSRFTKQSSPIAFATG